MQCWCQGCLTIMSSSNNIFDTDLRTISGAAESCFLGLTSIDCRNHAISVVGSGVSQSGSPCRIYVMVEVYDSTFVAISMGHQAITHLDRSLVPITGRREHFRKYPLLQNTHIVVHSCVVNRTFGSCLCTKYSQTATRSSRREMIID